MSGRYQKAPLVYVTALIRTTPLPTLEPEQWAKIEQAMVRVRLPIKAKSQGQALQFAPTYINTEENFTPQFHGVVRNGFFSSNRQESLIVDTDSIEWRASAYSRFDDLCLRIEQVFAALLSAVDVLGFVPSQELVLTYVDVIAPRSEKNRKLGDYFSGGQQILPLSLIGDGANDLQRVGQVQVTRIIEPRKRIFVSLEQLPVLKGAITRFLPQQIMEPDSSFNMPLLIQPEWKSLASTHYGLLTTQAASIFSTELRELKIREAFGPLHLVTRETFKELVNRDVCDVDWEFVEDKEA